MSIYTCPLCGSDQVFKLAAMWVPVNDVDPVPWTDLDEGSGVHLEYYCDECCNNMYRLKPVDRLPVPEVAVIEPSQAEVMLQGDLDALRQFRKMIGSL